LFRNLILNMIETVTKVSFWHYFMETAESEDIFVEYNYIFLVSILNKFICQKSQRVVKYSFNIWIENFQNSKFSKVGWYFFFNISADRNSKPKKKSILIFIIKLTLWKYSQITTLVYIYINADIAWVLNNSS